MLGFTHFLFVPGNRPDRIDGALASGAELVCIDLEDSVPASEKDSARKAALSAIAAARGTEAEARLALRVNGMATRAGWRDMIAIAERDIRPAALFLPMVESAAEPELLSRMLGETCPPIVPLIETVRGLRQADAIAAVPGIGAMMFGGGDFSAQLGVKLEWAPLLAARSAFIMACASAQVMAIDVPYLSLKDEEGLRVECLAARSLGFHAKAAIHPAQLPVIAEAMRPTDAEIAEAEAAEAAFAAGGGKAIAFRGRMLEEPVMQRYRQILRAAGRGALPGTTIKKNTGSKGQVHA